MKIIISEKELKAAVELSKDMCAAEKAFKELMNEPVGECDTCKYAGIFELKGIKRVRNIMTLEKRTTANLTTIFVLVINEDLVVDMVDVYGMVLSPLLRTIYPLIATYKQHVFPAIKNKFRKWSK